MPYYYMDENDMKYFWDTKIKARIDEKIEDLKDYVDDNYWQRTDSNGTGYFGLANHNSESGYFRTTGEGMIPVRSDGINGIGNIGTMAYPFKKMVAKQIIAGDKDVNDASSIKTGILPIERGGTGVGVNPSIRVQLNHSASANVFQSFPRPGVEGILPIANGGSGMNSSPVMRVNVGTNATDNVFKADPHPGVYGKLKVENGGTGADNAADARTNLGVITFNEIWKKIYPVGAVYLSFSSTSPASLFGGSWTQINGYFLRAANDTGTGGSNTHTLSWNEMPNHSHGVHPDQGTFVGDINWHYPEWMQAIASSYSDYTPFDAVYAQCDGAGGSGAHNNMPQYQNVYAWRRTA